MTVTVPVLALPGVRHGFFTRNAEGETAGNRNCAYRSGDNEAEVDANRTRCALAVGTDLAHLVTVKQRHTADVVVATAPVPWREAPVADALVTTTPGLSLGVLTADCAPVLLAAKNAKVIGAAHAGWRGAFDGVLENTVTEMERLGAARSDIVAAVGPCIGKASYEVGPEFVERFTAKDKSYAQYFSAPDAWGHAYFDLARFAADRLKAAGVGTVVVSGHDTCAEEAEFFSFRRATLCSEPDYGRQLSAIALSAIP
ncbi:MAG: peptidoglycan editing factor PgeF [Rhodospirillaceae bacterium]|nr:peptidoglycan editing factor PgeF [Rhodospirillaceae bacterium]